MEPFDLANSAAVLILWTVIGLLLTSVEKGTLMLMLSLLVLTSAFTFVASPSALINIGTLSCSLTLLTSRKAHNMPKIGRALRLNTFVYALIATLFFLPIALQDMRGWAIILGVAAKYWFLFSMAFVYSASATTDGRKIVVIAVTLLAALMWRFKLAFAFFAFLAIHFVLTTRSIRGSFSLIVSVVALSMITYLNFADEFSRFLHDSVLRPDYNYDTKLLGFSDGARLTIWSHYLEHSVWFGKGDSTIAETVPSHNIVVYLAHELGILGSLIFGPVLTYLTMKIAFQIGASLAFLLLLTFALSSVGEYPSIWAYCVIGAPVVFGFFFPPQKTRLAQE